jgi:hypothetical protein
VPHLLPTRTIPRDKHVTLHDSPKPLKSRAHGEDLSPARFGDWGRDKIISLPVLTLATGRAEKRTASFEALRVSSVRAYCLTCSPGAGTARA